MTSNAGVSDADDVLRRLVEREYDCTVERRAFELWLAFLKPLGKLTAVAGIALPALSGTAGLMELFGSASKLIAGLCALGAALATGVHAALKCDSHQAECARLINVYRNLEDAFRDARVLPATERPQRQQALAAQLEEVRLKATAAPPVKYRDRARAEPRPDARVLHAEGKRW